MYTRIRGPTIIAGTNRFTDVIHIWEVEWVANSIQTTIIINIGIKT